MSLNEDKKLEIIITFLVLLIIFPIQYMIDPEGFLTGMWIFPLTFYFASLLIGFSFWYYVYKTPYREEKTVKDVEEYPKLIYSGVSNRKDKREKIDSVVVIIRLVIYYFALMFILLVFGFPSLLYKVIMIIGTFILLLILYIYYSLIFKHIFFRKPTKLYNNHIIFSKGNKMIKFSKHEISEIYKAKWKVPSYIRPFYDRKMYSLGVETIEGDRVTSSFIKLHRLRRIHNDIEKFWGENYVGEDKNREGGIFNY